MRDRLIELIINADTYDNYECKLCNKDDDACDCCYAEKLADKLLANGVVCPPCKVGDTVWDTEGNAWKVFAITIWQDCIGLKTANDRGIRKTFTIGKHSIGKTVFLTREDAERALKGGDK